MGAPNARYHARANLGYIPRLLDEIGGLWTEVFGKVLCTCRFFLLLIDRPGALARRVRAISFLRSHHYAVRALRQDTTGENINPVLVSIVRPIN